MFRNTKKIEIIRKYIAAILLTAFVLSGTGVPALAGELIEDYQEQQKWQEILNDDQASDKTVIQDTAESDAMLLNETEKRETKTNEQLKAAYDQELERDTQAYESNRFIVKYLDEHSVPQFSDGGKKSNTDKDELGTGGYAKGSVLDSSKITAAGIESAEKLEGFEDSKFTVIETNIPMNKQAFMSAMKTSGLYNNVKYVQPDYEMIAASDPLLPEQWGLKSTQGSGSETTVGADVTEAWSYSTGEGVVIAVLDSGIDISHPDLEENIFLNNNEVPGNGIDDDGNGYIDDVNGWDFFNNDNNVNDVEWYYDQWHGTHVSGIVAAQKDNSAGIAGVSPNAKILPIKIFQGGVAYTSDIINAISYAEVMGAKIINCSWGGPFENPALEEAIANSSALFVCATGNNLYNTDHYPVYPAAFSVDHSNVVSVAAIDESGKLCRFSNYGAGTVDIAAPGAGIKGTWINEEYQSADGTSMSAAFVSGAAALVFADGQYSTAGTVKGRLIDSADTVTGLEDKVIGGKMLNCTYAVSGETVGNPNVIDIPDDKELPVVIPNTAPSEDEYEQYGAENYVSSRAPMRTARFGLQTVILNGKIYAIGGQTAESSGYTNIVEVYDPETDTWTAISPMNYSRSYFGAVVYNGKIYVMGGEYGDGSHRSNMEVYNPATNVWTTMSTTMPEAMRGFSATLIPGTDQVYVIGGNYSNSVYKYSINQNIWTEQPSLSRGISNHVAFYYNGKIYIEGGILMFANLIYTSHNEYQYTISAGTTSPAVKSRGCLSDSAGVLTNERFIGIGGYDRILSYYYNNRSANIIHSSLGVENTTTNSYYVTANHMQTARSGLGAVLLDGKVYMIGGISSSGVLASMEVMDLGWQEKDAPRQVANYKTVELDGKIYVMGGSRLVGGSAQRSRTVYVYDTANDIWRTLGTVMPVYAKNFSLTSAYGKIYLFGGETAATSTGSYTASNKIYEYDPQKDTWTEKNTLSAARHSLSSALFNGQIYITGGSNGSGLNTVEVYDPLKNTIIVKNNLPGTYSDHYSCVLNDKLYIFTSTQSNALKYDETSDGWNGISPAGSLDGNLFAPINGSLYSLGYGNTANINPTFYKYLPGDNIWTYYKTFNYYGFFQHVAVSNGKAYIFTMNSNGYSNGLVQYTPPASAWVNKAELSSSYRHSLSAAVLNGDIYAVGGYGDSGCLNTLEKYNETTDVWTTMAGMAYARSSLGLAAANGKLYAVGGKNNGNTALAHVEEYNTAANTWAIKASIPVATADMGIASYNNKIYIFGGTNASGAVLNTVRVYNPAANSWSTGAPMPTARYGCGAALIGNKIYVAGGFTGENISTNVLQVYDPTANTWDSSKAGMPVASGYAGVVASDSLYVIDGLNGTNEVSLVYEYSPVLNEWFSWSGPNHIRFSFGAAITSQGIYAIGGKNMNYDFRDVEFATINSISADYIHLGEDTINLSGNFSRTYTDMNYTAPGFNLQFSRTYNSSDDRTSPISTGWTFGFQGSVASSGNDVIVRLPNGSGNTFKKNTDGSFTALDSRSKLVKQADGTYILTTKDQYTYGFNTNGVLTWMKDRTGNTITLTVNSSGQVTQVTDQAGRATTIAYSNNRISTITDPAGRVVTYTYNGNNQLSQITDARGYSTYYYYTNGMLTSIKDNTNSAVIESITYLPAQDGKSPRAGTLTDKYGNVSTYTYDNNEGVLTAVDVNGRTNTTWYDSMLYPIRTRDAEGKETRTEYSLTGGLNHYGEVQSYTDRNGNTTYYERDIRGNLIRQVNPDNSVKEFTYDHKDNLLSEKDELGKYKFYVYDANGVNLVKVAQPLNGADIYSDGAPQSNFAITSYTYYTGAEAQSLFGRTIHGLLKTTADPEGGVTTIKYNSYGDIAAVVSPTNKTTTYQYNKLGWLKTVTTPKAYNTNYYYDKNGNLLKEVKHGGETTRFVYDFRNNVTQKIMPMQYLTAADAAAYDSERIQNSASNTYSRVNDGDRYTYNDKGELITQTDPLNNVTQYTYDIYGNKATETKPNSSIYLYDYDVMNRVTKVSFKESSAATAIMLEKQAYNILGSGKTTQSITEYLNDTQTAVTTTTYDYAGRQIRLDQPDGSYEANVYHANGTLANSTDARNHTTYYSYDGLNRLNGTWVPVTGNAYSYSSVTYDKAGRVTREALSVNYVANGVIPTTGLISTSYTYNLDGTVYQELSSSGAKKVYGYDNDGNRNNERTYYNANTYKEVTYSYNHLNKVVTQIDKVKNQDIAGYDNTASPLNLTSSYTYDANGNLRTFTNANGTTITYTYDLMDRQTGTSQPGMDEDNTVVTLTTLKTYDWAGNVLTTTDELNRVTNYTYDKREFLTKVTNALNGVEYYAYDRAGRKIAEVSPRNYSGSPLANLNRTEYTYDLMNRLLRKTQIYLDPDTSSWKQIVSKAYTYDNNGNIAEERDALGYLGGYCTIYEYDYANRKTKERDPESQRTGLPYSKRFAYDAAGRLTTETDANGYDTGYTYNDDGLVMTVTVDGVLMQDNAYDWQGNLLSQTDGNGNETTYAYNDLNKVRSVTASGDGMIDSYTVTYRYTKLGLLAEQFDSLEKQTVITYDRQGRKVSETEKKSNNTEAITFSYRYDKAGNLRYQTDSNENMRQFVYDALNRKTSESIDVTDINHNTATQTSTFGYDADGNKISEQNWLGNRYTYTYDPIGRLIERKDPYNYRIEKLVYNDNGAQIYSIDAYDNTKEFVYDRNGRLTESIDALGHSQKQFYDGVGNILRKQDGNLNDTWYTYDGLNRLTEVENALHEITSYAYDNNGNLLTQTNGKGNVTTIWYNCRNLPVVRIDAGGINQDGTIDETKVETYTYYADGKAETKVDRNGRFTNYTYDIHGRLLTQKTAGTQSISFAYDNNGNQLSMTDATGETRRDYDELNRVIQKTVPDIGTSTYQYDVTAGMPAYCVGEITTDPKGNINTQIYDRAGRLYQVKDGGAVTATYTYYNNGNLQKLQYPGSSEEYTYYPDNRLHTLANKRGGTIMEAYNYSYDPAGNQTEKLDGKGSTIYTYDLLNRLESVTEPGGKSTTYTYDSAGNRESETVTAQGTSVTTTYTYNEQNRLLQTEKQLPENASEIVTYTYDPNGNMLSQLESIIRADTGNPETFGLSQLGVNSPAKDAIYEYDTRNQLIRVSQGENIVENTYNGEGLRVAKTVNGETTRYLYEYDRIILETDEGGNETARNIFGTNLISRTAEGNTLHYLYNGHGDVTALISGSTVVARYYYDAFGVPAEETGNANNPYRYAGYEYDTEVDLYNLKARFYKADLARFLQEDTYRGTASDPLSLNLYTYCNNNPLIYIDPTGHRADGLYKNKDGSYTRTVNGKDYTVTKNDSTPGRYAKITNEYKEKEKNNVGGYPATSAGSSGGSSGSSPKSSSSSSGSGGSSGSSPKSSSSSSSSGSTKNSGTSSTGATGTAVRDGAPKGSTVQFIGKSGSSTIVISGSSGTKTLVEGKDYYIKGGTAYYKDTNSISQGTSNLKPLLVGASPKDFVDICMTNVNNISNNQKLTSEKAETGKNGSDGVINNVKIAINTTYVIGAEIKPMTKEEGTEIRNDLVNSVKVVPGELKKVASDPNTKQAVKNTAFTVINVHTGLIGGIAFGTIYPSSGDPEFDKAIRLVEYASWSSPAKWSDIKDTYDGLKWLIGR